MPKCKRNFCSLRQSPAYVVYYPEANKVTKVRCVRFIDRSENEISPTCDLEDEFLLDTKTTANDEVPNNVQLDENVSVAENGGNTRYPTRQQYFNECILDCDVHNDNANCTINYCYRVGIFPLE